MDQSSLINFKARPVRAKFLLVGTLLLIGMAFLDCRPVTAIPAFARKYGMPCSACHEAWPMLSPFGQQFKDNGYQMGNDRDAPIFQQAAYWPATFRITPIWHRQSTNKAAVDTAAGQTAEAQVITNGFDLSGLDFHTGGTLANNISFYCLPSSDPFGSFHFESAWARFDNLFGSPWLNVKMGKFELDNLLSEKRILTLTSIAGTYTNYHFQPLSSPGLAENYTFGIGDNQLGLEWLGHSRDDRTRVSAALLSQNDGQPGLPTSRAYGGFFAASRAFQAGSLGLQRVGAFAYIGQAPTYFQYISGGNPIAGTGIGNEGFQRIGVIGQWYIKKFDITTIYFYGHDSAYLGTNTPANQPLPAGAQAPTWNGALFESHYMFNPQWLLLNRYELVRMSQQAFGSGAATPNPSNLGNTDVLTFGMRYYPFISSRAGFALHAEYAIERIRGASLVTSTDITFNSLLFGWDFDF